MMTAVPVESLSRDETLLRVPKDLALLSLGFAIDAGGSVTKLLYRSKEDYQNGIRIGKEGEEEKEGEEGVLRMRYFPSEDSERLVQFLKEHCDILDSVKVTEVEGWYQTGVRTQGFMEQLGTVLDIKGKTKLLPEPVTICKGLLHFYPRVPDCRPYQLEPTAVGQALVTARSFLGMIDGSKKFVDENLVDKFSQLDPEFVIPFVKRIMTIDAETLVTELSQEKMEFPALCVTCGSADGMMLLTEDGKYDYANFSGVCGKTFLGLGKLLCQAKDFDELIEMASRGDHRKVDTLSQDLRVDNRADEDWYSTMPNDFVIFTMGKLTETVCKGTYTKEDLAAGILHLVTSVIAKVASTTARLLKVKSIVFNGSLLSRQVAREAMQKWLLDDILLQPLSGENQIKLVFIGHPGFLCTFGTWYYNWEKEQERRNKTPAINNFKNTK